MNYNKWYTNKKISDVQGKCDLCQKWDKYLYNVTVKETSRKLVVCFACYHQLINKDSIESDK